MLQHCDSEGGELYPLDSPLALLRRGVYTYAPRSRGEPLMTRRSERALGPAV